jgi:CBS domain-containing protein
MAKTISTVRPTETIGGVAGKMKAQDCGLMSVVNGGTLLGVVTDRDIVIRCLAEDHADPVSETTEHVMAEYEARRLPVIEHDALVGVLSYGNLEQALHAEGAAAAEASLGVTHGA